MGLPSPAPDGRDVTRLRDLSPRHWKSGAAAWLGWLFDGLDMHLYVLVAAPFVAELIAAPGPKDPATGWPRRAKKTPLSATTRHGSRPPSWSAGPSAVASSAGSATGSPVAGR